MIYSQILSFQVFMEFRGNSWDWSKSARKQLWNRNPQQKLHWNWFSAKKNFEGHFWPYYNFGEIEKDHKNGKKWPWKILGPPYKKVKIRYMFIYKRCSKWPGKSLHVCPFLSFSLYHQDDAQKPPKMALFDNFEIADLEKFSDTQGIFSLFTQKDAPSFALSFCVKREKIPWVSENFSKSTISKVSKSAIFWWFLGIILVKEWKTQKRTHRALFFRSFGTSFVNEHVSDFDFFIWGSQDFPRSFFTIFMVFFDFSKIIIRPKMTFKIFFCWKSIPMQLLLGISIP